MFRTNDCLEAKILNLFSSSLIVAENTLIFAYPELTTTERVEPCSTEIIQRSMDILRQARELSYGIQHDVISCRLVVTRTSDIAEIYGVFGLGLDKFTAEGHERLLDAESGA